MLEIPEAKNTDAEDVVWGLQTADTLWKRGGRIAALVWLRRAAQAAGDANDDDRALELARFAAELTEEMAREIDDQPLPEDPESQPALFPPLEDADGILYFGTQDDGAYALDREGAVRWCFSTGADVDAPLTLLGDGSLVVPSEDGTVTLLLP